MASSRPSTSRCRTAQLLLTWGGAPGSTDVPRAIGNRIERFVFTVGDATAAQTETRHRGAARRCCRARKGFAPDDKQAVRMWNNQEVYERFRGLFRGIRTFVWLIGLGTILAGVVGVSNIMLISVQERTREIGVRKAVGAPPSSIIAMILQEALAITLVSGYLGLCAGVALVSFAQQVIPPSPFFRQPDVDLAVGLAATGGAGGGGHAGRAVPRAAGGARQPHRGAAGGIARWRSSSSTTCTRSCRRCGATGCAPS